MVKISTARNWNELQDMLFESSWDERLGRFRSPFVFRGLSDASYTLTTSLQRLGGDFTKVENHLIRNFQKYARRDLVERDSIWNWISIAQHHGLPTRLLDWTFSPFVAMHFATVNIEKNNLDAVIWAVDFVRSHELIPEKLKTALTNEGSATFTVEMLSNIIPSLYHLDNLTDDKFLLFFDPPSVDDRIVNQYALFSVISDSSATMDNWINEHQGLVRKIIIPAKIKWEIRDKLDQANITERVLITGMDGLTQWLKRHYCSRSNFNQ